MKRMPISTKSVVLTAVIFSITCSLALIAACNKKLGQYNEDFLGRWHTLPTPLTTPGDSIRYEIVVEENDAAYRYSCETVCAPNLCDCLGQQTGKAVINSDRTLIRIGSSGAQPLTLNKEPFQDGNGKWVMEVEGLTYYKQ